MDFSRIKSKSDLKTFQRVFAEVIRRPLGKNSRSFRDKRSALIVKSSGSMTSYERMEVYSQQYWWRIQQSFDEDFIALQTVMTDGDYIKLRNQYLETHPSTSFTLRDLGSRLPDFLMKEKSLAKGRKALFRDCATYDWARIEAYGLAEFQRISAEAIRKAGFARKMLYLQPHVRLIKLDYPVHRLIEGSRIGDAGEPGKLIANGLAVGYSSSSRMKLKRAPVRLAVYRLTEGALESRIFVKELTPNQYTIISMFLCGASLKRVSENVFVSKVPSEEIGETFSLLMSLGWLTADRRGTTL